MSLIVSGVMKSFGCFGHGVFRENYERPADLVIDRCCASCPQCEPGRYGVEDRSHVHQGLMRCEQCRPGRFASRFRRRSCEPCPAGSFSSEVGQSRCQQCPRGRYSNAGNHHCEACAGKISRGNGTMHCVPCGDGGVPTANNEKCTCKAGRVPGQLDPCVRCDTSSFAAAGDQECSPCPLGYQTVVQQRSCTAVKLYSSEVAPRLEPLGACGA